jgi:hypothetical protein
MRELMSELISTSYITQSLYLCANLLYLQYNRIFTKEMRPGDVSCCHYSNKDCSSDGKDDEVNSFHVSIIKECGILL